MTRWPGETGLELLQSTEGGPSAEERNTRSGMVRMVEMWEPNVERAGVVRVADVVKLWKSGGAWQMMEQVIDRVS